jgi:hypothetical protein
MDKEKYNEGMQRFIDDGPYELMTSNPLNRTVESAKNMIRELVETVNLSSYWKNQLKVSNPQIPLLYGLPKTHKERNKMRPITSNVDSRLKRVNSFKFKIRVIYLLIFYYSITG